jgi:hypothetical protein
MNWEIDICILELAKKQTGRLSELHFTKDYRIKQEELPIQLLQ